jgi:hypothetical protein
MYILDTIFQVRSAKQPTLTPVALYHKMVRDNDRDARLPCLSEAVMISFGEQTDLICTWLYYLP